MMGKEPHVLDEMIALAESTNEIIICLVHPDTFGEIKARLPKPTSQNFELIGLEIYTDDKGEDLEQGTFRRLAYRPDWVRMRMSEHEKRERLTPAP